MSSEEDKGDEIEITVSSEDSQENDPEGKNDFNMIDESSKENNPNKVNEEILKTLGEDPEAWAKSLRQYHPELKSRWVKWIEEGLPEKAKKEILGKYSRAGEILLEAPKVNLGIPMTEVATKREKHFIELQKTVGSAIAAQATAISMMLETAPGEDVDQEAFCELLSHAGQLLTDTFYQLSVTRKSFITPLMDKIYKSSLDETKADEWLYGEKFTDQVKEVKILEKTSSTLKPAIKKQNPQKISGNGKYPSVKPKQVGSSQGKKPTFKFNRRGTYQQNQSTFKSFSRPSSQTSSRK